MSFLRGNLKWALTQITSCFDMDTFACLLVCGFLLMSYYVSKTKQHFYAAYIPGKSTDPLYILMDI